MESPLRPEGESSLPGPHDHGAYSPHLMKNPFPSLPLGTLTALAALVLPSASLFAQAPAATPAPGAAAPAAKPLSPVEKNFIKNAGKSLYYLIQVNAPAKTAVTAENLSRSRDKLSSDLKKAYDGLNTLAKARGETITSELTGGDKAGVERLGKMKDDKFTKQWVDELMKEAKKLNKDFEAAERTLQAPDVKQYAADYSAIVRGIFASVESMEKALKKK